MQARARASSCMFATRICATFARSVGQAWGTRSVRMRWRRCARRSSECTGRPRRTNAGCDDSDYQSVRARVTAAVPDWPDDASVMVVGTFTPAGSEPVDFRVFIEAEIEIEMHLSPPLVVDSGDGTVVTVDSANRGGGLGDRWAPAEPGGLRAGDAPGDRHLSVGGGSHGLRIAGVGRTRLPGLPRVRHPDPWLRQGPALSVIASARDRIAVARTRR